MKISSFNRLTHDPELSCSANLTQVHVIEKPSQHLIPAASHKMSYDGESRKAHTWAEMWPKMQTCPGCFERVFKLNPFLEKNVTKLEKQTLDDVDKPEEISLHSIKFINHFGNYGFVSSDLQIEPFFEAWWFG